MHGSLIWTLLADRCILELSWFTDISCSILSKSQSIASYAVFICCQYVLDMEADGSTVIYITTDLSYEHGYIKDPVQSSWKRYLIGPACAVSTDILTYPPYAR